GHALFQTMSLEIPHFLADDNEVASGLLIDVALVHYDFGFKSRRRVCKLQPHEPLASRLFQILYYTLIAGIIRDDEHELGRRVKNRTSLLDGQNPPVVGQGMDENDRVLTGFYDLVQIANGAVLYRECKRTIVPYSLISLKEKAAYQVGRRKVFVTSDRDQGTAQSPGHVFHKTGLAAAGGTLKHRRQPGLVGRFKQFYLAGNRQVVRLAGY